jgi:spermidine dehydrogenase
VVRRNWSPVAKGLSDELGIDTGKFFKAFDATPYTSRGLGQGVFFDRETWTVDRLVKGGQGNAAEGPPPPDRWWRSFAANAPFSDAARRDFVRLHEERTDYLPGLSVQEKRARLRTISYRDLLRDLAKVDPQVVQYFQQRTHSGWGVGIDAIPASGAISFLPGFLGMGLAPRQTASDPYIFHFPDGNASIARLLVRAMIPSVAPGTTMDDVVMASRSSCITSGCRASQGYRGATNTAPAAASCCRPPSRPSSGGRAISWRGRSAAAGSIPQGTSRGSPSTAGRTATPTSAIR